MIRLYLFQKNLTQILFHGVKYVVEAVYYGRKNQ